MSALAHSRAERNFQALAEYKQEGERRRIPQALAEIHAEQQWLALGYASFGKACDAIFGGWRPSWQVQERQAVVTELTQKGMSTRAIASVVGVHKDTVRNDQKASGGEYSPPEIRGSDGKTYTRPDPQKRQPVAEHLDRDNDPELRASRLKHEFSKWLWRIHQAHRFDPAEMAVLSPDQERDVDETLRDLARFAEAFRKAAREHRFAVVDGGRS